jgi:hypothetical protein
MVNGPGALIAKAVARLSVLGLARLLRQLGDIERDAPRLIACQQFSR